MTWRVLLLTAAASIASALSLSAQPVITELQPRGAQKGKPFTLTLAGRNLGEGVKTWIFEELNIKGVTLVDASSYSECVSKLKSGALDAVSTDDLILAGFANQQKGSFKVINDPFTDEKYGVGLKKGDTETCEAVNKAVAQMYSDGTAKTLLEKHFAGTGLKLVTTAPQMEGCA